MSVEVGGQQAIPAWNSGLHVCEYFATVGCFWIWRKAAMFPRGSAAEGFPVCHAVVLQMPPLRKLAKARAASSNICECAHSKLVVEAGTTADDVRGMFGGHQPAALGLIFGDCLCVFRNLFCCILRFGWVAVSERVLWPSLPAGESGERSSPGACRCLICLLEKCIEHR